MIKLPRPCGAAHRRRDRRGCGAALVDAAVRELGRLDVLITTPRYAPNALREDITYDEWRRVLPGARRRVPVHPGLPAASHPRGRRHGDQHRRPDRAPRRRRPAPRHRGKSRARGLTRGLALDFAPHHITVTASCRGPSRRAGLPGVPERPEHRRSLRRSAAAASRGDRRDGAHAVQPRRTLHHGPVEST